MRWSALAAVFLFLSPQATLAQPVVTNVGIDASLGFVLENGFVAFRASELGSGEDFNLDGDQFDYVLHIYDVNADRLINTGLEATGQINVSGNYVAWTVFEINQGGVSLNGDSDAFDFVLHIADMTTGVVTNLGLAASDPMIEGDTLGVLVLENSQAMTDLNGDGDAGDAVFHTVHIPTNTVTNVGVDASSRFVLDGTRAILGTSESAQNATDLNGDGDVSDTVLQVWDGTSITNLGLASDLFEFQLEGDLLACLVSEESQGDADLNDDGDATDKVLHWHDFDASQTTNVELAVQRPEDFRLDGGLVAMAVSESFQGTDLNGDIDAFDDVLFLLDGSDGSVTNLAFAIEGFQLANRRLAFGVRELRHFVLDLNGDGDTADLVLHFYDVDADTTTNLETDTSFGFKLDDEMLLGFGASEANQGGNDGNGDGDANDFTLYVFDFSTGELESLAVDPSGGLQTFQVDGKFVSFAVNEFQQGSVDLNNDADFGDVVLHYYDAETGDSTNLELDVTLGHQLQDGIIAFVVTEDNQGMTDLNSDGDAFDVVLHVANLEPDGPVSPHDAIEELIAHVKSLDLGRRIERSRVILLRLAQRALERDKPCLSMRFLRIFQWSVRARAGRGIPVSDARALIAEAGAIIELIGDQHPDCRRHHHRRHGRRRHHR